MEALASFIAGDRHVFIENRGFSWRKMADGFLRDLQVWAFWGGLYTDPNIGGKIRPIFEDPYNFYESYFGLVERFGIDWGDGRGRCPTLRWDTGRHSLGIAVSIWSVNRGETVFVEGVDSSDPINPKMVTVELDRNIGLPIIHRPDSRPAFPVDWEKESLRGLWFLLNNKHRMRQEDARKN